MECRLTEWRWCLAALVLATVARAVAAEPRGVRDRPNVVLIMADDLGVGDLGCYGQQLIQTPRIDRMAVEGVRFTQAYAGAPVCAPSRCVLMTGLHAGHARIRDNSGRVGGVADEMSGSGHRIPLLDEDLTVAEVLKQAGYATGITGKWGLGEAGTTGEPTRQGFDEWYGFLNQNHAVDHFPDHLWHDGRRVIVEENRDGGRSRYANDLFAEFAIDFIRRHRGHPFFLYLPFTIPHADLEVPSQEPYADRDWPEDSKTVAAMVTRMDRDVGRLLDLLAELGLERNTLVLFTSDNGSPEAGGPLLCSNGGLRGRKGSLHEGGLRVPMIARWPGRVAAGAVNDEPCTFADLLPTLAELADARLPVAVDGVSIAATLAGDPQDLAGRFLYWERPAPKFQQAARRGRFKALRAGRHTPLQLFDLGVDPGEACDVAAEHPDVVAAFDDFLATAREASPHWPDPPPDDAHDAAARDAAHDAAGDGHARSSSAGEPGRPSPARAESSPAERPPSTTRLPNA
ncbi:MAG: arylsulfatase [Planctomycetaceae bacterium]